MKHSITICIISAAGRRIRQATVSRGFVGVMGMFILAGMGSAVVGYHQYLASNEATMNTRNLETVISRQRWTILRQRDKIQQFAHQLENMGKRMAELKQMEEKIRIIADMGASDGAGGRFGMGGVPPETVDAALGTEARSGRLIRQMDKTVRGLGTALEWHTQSLASLFKGLTKKADRLASTPSIRPVGGWKTSGFGLRLSPFTGQEEFHRALDIANEAGTPIMATADGVVIRSGRAGPRGNRLVIDHGYGMTTCYAHAARLMKKKGARVQRGETIALMGSTGRSTGPHLHYEVRLNGVPVNPEAYILN